MLPDVKKQNFLDFSVDVNSVRVLPELKQRAISSPLDDDSGKKIKYSAGTDISQAVHKAGLPFNANLPDWRAALDRLSSNDRKALVADGILYGNPDDGYDEDLVPQWSLYEAYHWEQTFPANDSERNE